jgi:hypothetical protein
VVVGYREPRIRIMARAAYRRDVATLEDAGAAPVFSDHAQKWTGAHRGDPQGLGATAEQIDRERGVRIWCCSAEKRETPVVSARVRWRRVCRSSRIEWSCNGHDSGLRLLVERPLPMSVQLNPSDASFPPSSPLPECPKCSDERCRPMAVTSRVGGVTVKYRCEGCGYEWSIDQTRTPLFGSAR